MKKKDLFLVSIAVLFSPMIFTVLFSWWIGLCVFTLLGYLLKPLKDMRG